MNKPFAVSGMNVVSPKGQAVWCKVTEPDRKFDPEGTLSTDLVLDPNAPDVKAFIERLEALQDKAFEETKESMGAKAAQVKKRNFYADEYDQDGSPTGKIVFKFKLKNVDARREKGQQHEIQVVDANKQAVKPVPLVGNGSTIRVASYVYPYYMASTKELGLSMLWSKMQIIDLVEYSGGKGDDFDTEDGYAASSSGAESFGDDDF
jgi:hypothetical protein